MVEDQEQKESISQFWDSKNKTSIKAENKTKQNKTKPKPFLTFLLSLLKSFVKFCCDHSFHLRNWDISQVREKASARFPKRPQKSVFSSKTFFSQFFIEWKLIWENETNFVFAPSSIFLLPGDFFQTLVRNFSSIQSQHELQKHRNKKKSESKLVSLRRRRRRRHRHRRWNCEVGIIRMNESCLAKTSDWKKQEVDLCSAERWSEPRLKLEDPRL